MNIETQREQLAWTIKYALWKNRRHWPKNPKGEYSLMDQMDQIAKHVVTHIELSGFDISKRKVNTGHSAPVQE